MKQDKGITLIALIITIVVLLIIVVVTIGTITESNIIGYAENAAKGYNSAKDEENTILEGYLSIIEGNSSSSEVKGTYGMPKVSEDGKYICYVFNQDGTGEYLEYKEEDKTFKYTMTDSENGTIIFQDNSEYGFKVKNTESNKFIIIYDLDGEGYHYIYTTNGSSDFQKLENGIYKFYEDALSEENYLGDITFNNGVFSGKIDGEEISLESGESYIYEDNIYHSAENIDNVYYTFRRLEGDSIIEY